MGEFPPQTYSQLPSLPGPQAVAAPFETGGEPEATGVESGDCAADRGQSVSGLDDGVHGAGGMGVSAEPCGDADWDSRGGAVAVAAVSAIHSRWDRVISGASASDVEGRYSAFEPSPPAAADSSPVAMGVACAGDLGGVCCAAGAGDGGADSPIPGGCDAPA